MKEPVDDGPLSPCGLLDGGNHTGGSIDPLHRDIAGINGVGRSSHGRATQQRERLTALRGERLEIQHQISAININGFPHSKLTFIVIHS